MIIGLDVGGTHTDIVLLGSDGPVRQVKVLTNISDLFSSILSGLETVTQDIPFDDIRRIVLSTTLSTNSVVTGNMEEVGMLVSGGPGIDPMLYRTNNHYYKVSGAIDHRGRESESVNESEIEAIAEKLVAEKIRYVGVAGKFSTRNPAHEIRIGKILERYGFEKIFPGHKVSGNLNFPRRIATTFINASVYGIHKKFFGAVKDALDKRGLNVPIHILKADGGTMSLASSLNYPAQTILSGPSASVMGALSSAPVNEDVVVLDIGGTTTDISVIINGAPVLEPLGISLGNYKTLIRSLKTVSIGIGGDSVVKVNGQILEIGPERAGQALAYGGPLPTPTDAFCVLGTLTDANRERAVEGMDRIAEKIGTTTGNAASKTIHLACRKIIEEVNNLVMQINSKPVYTVHELLEGYTVNPARVLVLGGPADHFAHYLGEMLAIPVQPVPRWEVANAIGAGLARTTCEVTLFADTEKGVMLAPEENYTRSIKGNFTLYDAEQVTLELLKNKAFSNGASREDFEAEITERLEFNMVRGFRTSGKNIRITAQVKPGLIHGYT